MSMRVRFAPSPTGALHIGGVRTALFNYLLAKKHGGTFILRIEDTDQNRFVPGAEQYIIDTLKWCGIVPTEGIGFGDGNFAPYRQSERKHIYKKYADELINKGHAYYAFDTPEELEAMRERLKNDNHQAYDAKSRNTMRNSVTLNAEATEKLISEGTPYVVRLKVPTDEVIEVDDIIRGKISFNTQELDDKVLMKADGMPTYHLANVVDDFEMQITHVIRGEEWLPSAGHHVLLYRVLGWLDVMPQFAHLPLILKPDGKGKLSKRDGAKFGFPVFPIGWQGDTPENSFEGFKEKGFYPEAVINFLALLGWSSGTEQEIFSLDELVDLFSLEKIHKAGARFDYDKAKWFNQQYIMRTPNNVLAEQLQAACTEKGYTVSKEYLTGFAGLMKERVVFFNDFLEKGVYFFEEVKTYDKPNLEKRWKGDTRAKFSDVIRFIETLNFQDAPDMEHAVKDFITANGLKLGEVFPTLRIALAGTMQGPGIFDMAMLFGKTKTIERLKKAQADFEASV